MRRAVFPVHPITWVIFSTHPPPIFLVVMTGTTSVHKYKFHFFL